MMSASPLSPDPPVGFSLVRGAVGVGLDLRLLACGLESRIQGVLKRSGRIG